MQRGVDFPFPSPWVWTPGDEKICAGKGKMKENIWKTKAKFENEKKFVVGLIALRNYWTTRWGGITNIASKSIAAHKQAY